MLILGIETSTSHASVALSSNDSLLVSARLGRQRGHAEFVAPAIEFLLRAAGVSVSEIDLLAAGVGPGLFTGMRVGIATIRAMSMALSLPAVGVSSLSTLADGAREGSEDRPVAAVIDARRGEVFWRIFRAGEAVTPRPDGIRLGKPGLCAAEITEIDGVVAVGDGLIAHKSDFAADLVEPTGGAALAFPDAAALNRIAHASWVARDNRPGTATELDPIYIRRSDAEINWTTAEREAPTLSGSAK